MPDWGLLPNQVIRLIIRRKWDKMPSLKARLLGEKSFPIRIKLKAPNGSAALENMAHFLNFLAEWKAFPYPEMLIWETRNFRNFSDQCIPTFLIIDSIKQLIKLLGREALEQSELWERNMIPLLGLETGQSRQSLYPILVQWLEEVEKLSKRESELLAKLLPQLKPGLGSGCYLRALPLQGIDTKFLEKYQPLIEALVDSVYVGAVSAAGGLVNWLDCQINPKGWLLIRPLCWEAKRALGNLPILKVPANSLKTYALPAKNILVVENVQSGLALPDLNDGIAVIGGGKNVSWMAAAWLQDRRVGYWGDIDSWGLHILSKARRRLSSVKALMMDRATLKAYEENMVYEPESILVVPDHLNEAETKLFHDLIAGKFESTRLEQERISSDYIR